MAGGLSDRGSCLNVGISCSSRCMIFRFIDDAFFVKLRRYYRTDFFYQNGQSRGGADMPYFHISR